MTWARMPKYEVPRRGAATDSEVEEQAMRKMRKRHEQEFKDTPEEDWPKLYQKHRSERDEDDERSPLHDNPRSP